MPVYKNYVIKPGDTIESIASEWLGSSIHTKRIIELNRLRYPYIAESSTDSYGQILVTSSLIEDMNLNATQLYVKPYLDSGIFTFSMLQENALFYIKSVLSTGKTVEDTLVIDQYYPTQISDVPAGTILFKSPVVASPPTNAQDSDLLDTAGYCSFLGKLTDTTLTVTQIIHGYISVGMTIQATDSQIMYVVINNGTGTGLLGTYKISPVLDSITVLGDGKLSTAPDAIFTANISSNQLVVTSVESGTLNVGQIISGRTVGQKFASIYRSTNSAYEEVLQCTTVNPHGLSNGAEIVLSNLNVAPLVFDQGPWTIQNVTSNTFEINLRRANGNGIYMNDLYWYDRFSRQIQGAVRSCSSIGGGLYQGTIEFNSFNAGTSPYPLDAPYTYEGRGYDYPYSDGTHPPCFVPNSTLGLTYSNTAAPVGSNLPITLFTITSRVYSGAHNGRVSISGTMTFTYSANLTIGGVVGGWINYPLPINDVEWYQIVNAGTIITSDITGSGNNGTYYIYSFGAQNSGTFNQTLTNVQCTAKNTTVVNAPTIAALTCYGEYVYVVDSFYNQITCYQFDPYTKNLVTIGNPQQLSTPGSIKSVVRNPLYPFLFVGSYSSIDIFSIDELTGEISFNTSISTALYPMLCVHPNGQFLYTMTNDRFIKWYSINLDTGFLTYVGKTSQSYAYWSPREGCLAIDPQGSFLYVLMSYEFSTSYFGAYPAIKLFGINPDNGSLLYLSEQTLILSQSSYESIEYSSNAQLLLNNIGTKLYVFCFQRKSRTSPYEPNNTITFSFDNAMVPTLFTFGLNPKNLYSNHFTLLNIKSFQHLWNNLDTTFSLTTEQIATLGSWYTNSTGQMNTPQISADLLNNQSPINTPMSIDPFSQNLFISLTPSEIGGSNSKSRQWNWNYLQNLGDKVLHFSINQLTGIPEYIDQYETGKNPGITAVLPAGPFLFVVNTTFPTTDGLWSNISVYDINTYVNPKILEDFPEQTFLGTIPGGIDIKLYYDVSQNGSIILSRTSVDYPEPRLYYVVYTYSRFNLQNQTTPSPYKIDVATKIATPFEIQPENSPPKLLSFKSPSVWPLGATHLNIYVGETIENIRYQHSLSNPGQLFIEPVRGLLRHSSPPPIKNTAAIGTSVAYKTGNTFALYKNPSHYQTQVLKPGDVLLLPITTAQLSPNIRLGKRPKTFVSTLGSDIMLSPNGQIQLNNDLNGDMDVISGVDNVKQSLLGRMSTVIGALKTRKTFGNKTISLMGQKYSPSFILNLKSDLVDCIRSEPRVYQVNEFDLFYDSSISAIIIKNLSIQIVNDGQSSSIVMFTPIALPI